MTDRPGLSAVGKEFVGYLYKVTIFFGLTAPIKFL